MVCLLYMLNKHTGTILPDLCFTVSIRGKEKRKKNHHRKLSSLPNVTLNALEKKQMSHLLACRCQCSGDIAVLCRYECRASVELSSQNVELTMHCSSDTFQAFCSLLYHYVWKEAWCTAVHVCPCQVCPLCHNKTTQRHRCWCCRASVELDSQKVELNKMCCAVVKLTMWPVLNWIL